MANELRFVVDTGGVPLTARLVSGATVVADNIALTEVFGHYYVGDVPPALPRGAYVAFALNSVGEVVSMGELFWLGDRELDPTILDDISLIHGLRTGAPLSVTPSQRSAGSINQSITQVGDSVTVSRTS